MSLHMEKKNHAVIHCSYVNVIIDLPVCLLLSSCMLIVVKFPSLITAIVVLMSSATTEIGTAVKSVIPSSVNCCRTLFDVYLSVCPLILLISATRKMKVAGYVLFHCVCVVS